MKPRRRHDDDDFSLLPPGAFSRLVDGLDNCKLYYWLCECIVTHRASGVGGRRDPGWPHSQFVYGMVRYRPAPRFSSLSANMWRGNS